MLASHALDVWRGMLATEAAYAIDIEEAPPSHVGLASSAALQVAIVSALNWLHGVPVTEHAIRTAVATAYREAVDGELVSGFTTGLSSFLNLYGGFALLDEEGRILHQLPAPPWMVLFASVAADDVSSFGDAEAELLMDEGRRLDARDASRKRAVMLERLVPAVRRADLIEVGNAVDMLMRLGSKRGEIGLYGARARDALAQLREKLGVECAFLSAVGPGIAIITERPLQPLRAECGRRGLSVLHEGRLNSSGIEIESVVPTRP